MTRSTSSETNATSPGSSAPWLRFAAYALMVLLAVALPLLLTQLRPRFVSMSYGPGFLPFELLGLSGGLSILVAGAFELRRRRDADLPGRVAVLVPCLLALQLVTQTSEYAQRRFDYDCYEYAGRALLAGESPYRVGLIYLYPPPTAQVFAAAHTSVTALYERLGAPAERDEMWDRVFYLYQCAQVLLVLGAYFLLLRFGRDLGLVSRWAPVLVGALLLFDNAVFRTLRHGQINFWVLDLALAGLVWARSRPALAGTCVALAGHVKLYPLLLLLPLLAGGRRRAGLWALAAAAAVALVSSDFGRDVSLWSQYLALAGSGFGGEIAFRNGSLHSMAFNTATLVFGARGDGRAVAWTVRIATLGFGVFWLVRFASRERIRRGTVDSGTEVRCFAAHGADALAFSLLLSPSVWEHHYVMALPLAIAACVARGGDRPGLLLLLGLFLALGMPTFDVYPLGYHRFAGLLLLLVLTPPRLAAAAAEGSAAVPELASSPPTSARPER